LFLQPQLSMAELPAEFQGLEGLREQLQGLAGPRAGGGGGAPPRPPGGGGPLGGGVGPPGGRGGRASPAGAGGGGGVRARGAAVGDSPERGRLLRRALASAERADVLARLRADGATPPA